MKYKCKSVMANFIIDQEYDFQLTNVGAAGIFEDKYYYQNNIKFVYLTKEELFNNFSKVANKIEIEKSIPKIVKIKKVK